MKNPLSLGIAIISWVAVLALAVLLTACSQTGGKLTADRILISDNVELEVGDSQAVFDREPSEGSFNEYGYYLSPRFFLWTGDTIRVVVTGDAPITLSGGSSTTHGGLQTGLNSIGEEDEPTSNIDLSYFTITTSTSANNMWEVIYTFPSEQVPKGYYQIPSGYYQLNIYNDSGNQADCMYAITLLAG